MVVHEQLPTQLGGVTHKWDIYEAIVPLVLERIPANLVHPPVKQEHLRLLRPTLDWNNSDPVKGPGPRCVPKHERLRVMGLQYASRGQHNEAVTIKSPWPGLRRDANAHYSKVLNFDDGKGEQVVLLRVPANPLAIPSVRGSLSEKMTPVGLQSSSCRQPRPCFSRQLAEVDSGFIDS